MLNIVDEFTTECLAIRIARTRNATAVVDVLTDLFMPHGVGPATSARTMMRATPE